MAFNAEREFKLQSKFQDKTLLFQLTTMSADMFAPQKSSTPSTTTKIPMPSPTPLRRSASLRIRGEAAPLSRAPNPLHKHHNPGGGGGGGGGALMDAAKSRPIIRTPGASPRVPQSPVRNRSLVSARGWWGNKVLIRGDDGVMWQCVEGGCGG